jgi:hypothetical protein
MAFVFVASSAATFLVIAACATYFLAKLFG